VVLFGSIRGTHRVGQNTTIRPPFYYSMVDKIVIFGTGTFAELAAFYFTHDSDIEVVAHTADREYVDKNRFNGLQLVPFDDIAREYPPDEYGMFVAIGYRDVNALRKEKFSASKDRGYELVSYLNSSVTHYGDTDIGDNCFIFEDQTIQPHVEIGDDVIIWSGNHIGHDSTIHDHAFITSHTVISGYVSVGKRAFLGVNSTLRDEIEIGEQCVVGAGATIVSDTEPKSVYLGSPAERYEIDSNEVDI
jgi:sugar O-acyltransferase (sialic acid O-acetyltransferase NeuD family)